jgi:acyl-coenzyme A synthetase/AMP-(fatty) acid ligase
MTKGLVSDGKKTLNVCTLYYFSECKRDAEGYYWIVGRVDDCMNVSGHLLSTAEIESALVEHGAVSEAAVVNITALFH